MTAHFRNGPCTNNLHIWSYVPGSAGVEPHPDDTCDCGMVTWSGVHVPTLHALDTTNMIETFTADLGLEYPQGTITINPAILPAIAAEMHAIWTHWMEYLFEKAPINDDGTATISAYHVERWHRQMYTPYADLSESEQASDIEQAKKVLAAIFGVVPDLRPDEWKEEIR